MIQANELRIGNWVNDIKGGGYNNPGLVQVRTIGSEGINSWQDMSASGCTKYEDLQPIPLTPEILEACGFINTHYGYNHKDEDFEIDDGSNYLQYSYNDNEYSFGPEIKYLHQLQNLYFALTQKELKYTIMKITLDIRNMSEQKKKFIEETIKDGETFIFDYKEKGFGLVTENFTEPVLDFLFATIHATKSTREHLKNKLI